MAKPYFQVAADETKRLINSGITELYGVEVINSDDATYCIQLFDATAIADVTLNSTVPDYVVFIRARASATQKGIETRDWNKEPLRFAKGLVYAITTTATGLTGPTTDLPMSASYRDVRR